MKHSQEDTAPPGPGPSPSLRPSALVLGHDPAAGTPRLVVVAWAGTVLG